MLDVGQGNLVYWEACGNPAGKPAVVIHGGPGSGCSTGVRRSFDPDRYRAVLFDQRGCGRSTEHPGIDRWLLYGGSWGSTLILAYAERHPHRVSEIVIPSVTTTRRSEIDWLCRASRDSSSGAAPARRRGAALEQPPRPTSRDVSRSGRFPRSW